MIGALILVAWFGLVLVALGISILQDLNGGMIGLLLLLGLAGLVALGVWVSRGGDLRDAVVRFGSPGAGRGRARVRRLGRLAPNTPRLPLASSARRTTRTSCPWQYDIERTAVLDPDADPTTVLGPDHDPDHGPGRGPPSDHGARPGSRPDDGAGAGWGRPALMGSRGPSAGCGRPRPGCRNRCRRRPRGRRRGGAPAANRPEPGQARGSLGRAQGAQPVGQFVAAVTLLTAGGLFLTDQAWG